MAAINGVLDTTPALTIMLESDGTNASNFARNYLWKRLALDFTPSATWHGWRTFPKEQREELIAARTDEEAMVKSLEADARTLMNAEQIKQLDQEYRDKKATIKKNILSWSARYPALKAGEHGWYEK